MGGGGYRMCQQHRGDTSVWGMAGGEVIREGFQGGEHENDLEEAQGSMQVGARTERAMPGRRNKTGM